MKITNKFIEIWDSLAPICDEQTKNELSDFHTKIYTHLIIKNAPKKTPLKILDVGCGAGFFSIILSHEGHNVTGIDISPKMIEMAKNNAKNERVEPEFLVMDTHKTNFRDYSFDLIISRNTIHALDDPELAYREYKRLLKPAAKLIIFDSNPYLKYYDDDIYINYERNTLIYEATYSQSAPYCLDDKFEKYKYSIPLSEIVRPAWDKKTLTQIGYVDITISNDISNLVNDKKEQLINETDPMFMIVASRAKSQGEENASIQKYWADQKQQLKDDCLKNLEGPMHDIWGDLISSYLPRNKQLKILCIGCGSGFIPILMALKRHEVIGIDYSCSMIAEAIDNARSVSANVHFICSEVDNLPFENESFDVIISKNIVWNLPNPELAFSEWRRVLSVGGRLIYFDGNWSNPIFDSEDLAEYNIDREQTFIKDSLYMNKRPLAKENRPEWDQLILPKWGLEPLYVKCDVSEQLWSDDEKAKFFATPFYMIIAEKMRRVK